MRDPKRDRPHTCDQALPAAVEQSREQAAANGKTTARQPCLQAAYDGIGSARYPCRPGLGQLGNLRVDFLDLDPRSRWIRIRGDDSNNTCCHRLPGGVSDLESHGLTGTHGEPIGVGCEG